MADVRDVLAHPLRGPFADVVLELVDLVVEAVDHGEELLGDLVEEEIQVQTGRIVVSKRGLADRADVARGSTRRGLAHGHEAIERGHDVELVNRRLGVLVDSREHQHAEHVVPVRLEPRPGLVVVAGRCAQALERGRVHGGGERGVERGVVGVAEVDPPFGLGHGATIWGSRRRAADQEGVEQEEIDHEQIDHERIDHEQIEVSIRTTASPPHHPALVEHAAVRAESVQNRVADRITTFAGSMAFVYIHLLWFAVWIIVRVEKYPFGLLTMIVSLEAIFLSTFVMISQNRADAKRQVLADHQWETVQAEEKQNEMLITISNQILELTRAIHVLSTEAAGGTATAPGNSDG